MTTQPGRAFDLGPMPFGRPMQTVDEQVVRAPLATILELATQVEDWPRYLPHYRYVRFRSRRSDGGGLVEMSAYRPFRAVNTPKGPLRINWPTWWLSEMAVDRDRPAIRFRHVAGTTKEMDVEWSFTPTSAGTHVRIVHLWDGPRIPLIGRWAAVYLIGPVFVHGIASRTLAGLAEVAERKANKQQQ